MSHTLWSHELQRILQAGILEWFAIPFTRGSSQPRDQTWVSCIAGRFFTIRAPKDPVQTNKYLKKLNVWATQRKKGWTALCVEWGGRVVTQGTLGDIKNVEALNAVCTDGAPNDSFYFTCHSTRMRRKWQPTPVFWSGESHGQRSLADYSPRGHKAWDTTEQLALSDNGSANWQQEVRAPHGWLELTCWLTGVWKINRWRSLSLDLRVGLHPGSECTVVKGALGEGIQPIQGGSQRFSWSGQLFPSPGDPPNPLLLSEATDRGPAGPQPDPHQKSSGIGKHI